MQITQKLVGQYRRKRLLIAAVVTALVLILTLSFRFVVKKSDIEQQTKNFAAHTIERFDNVFSPLDVSATRTLDLVGLSCPRIRFSLIQKLAALQTVRAIVLVNNDTIYCSGLFGQRNLSFSAAFPRFAEDNQRMLLTTDKYLLKGSPVLLFWTPKSPDNRSGIFQVINIEMINHYLLEPMRPWVTRAVLNVAGNSLEYGHSQISQVTPSDDEVSYQKESQRYPYSVTLFTPSPVRLALTTLPAELPLAMMFSLLMGYIVWLATANRMSLWWQISYGLSANEFMVWCQPLINTRSGKCDGIELLLRWHNPRQGWIPPDVFIPLVERQNLIKPLTRFVLSEVVRQLPCLPQCSSFHIAINVAAIHFRDKAILDDLNTLWWPANPAPQLVLELTEREPLPVVDQSVVMELHNTGVQLAIDDFGTGHSSLSYLRTLQPDVLKIDKIYTAAIGTDAINATVTDTVISLAQQLNISLVAEGVETAEQACYLRQRGVDRLQGYFYARPMPIADFPAWLTQYPVQGKT